MNRVPQLSPPRKNAWSLPEIGIHLQAVLDRSSSCVRNSA